MTIILASKSPRRKELLSKITDDFIVDVVETDEIFDYKLSLEQAIQKVALQKAIAVYDKHQDDIIISADTIVVYNNEIFGKPKDKADAFRMLKALSNKTHQVITGVAVVRKDKQITFSSISQVIFNELSDEEINEYILTNEPLDKAGAYGIQGKGALLVKEIQGDFYSIMGLPISQLNQVLKAML